MKEGSLTTIAFLTMGSMSRQTTLPEGERERERERGERQERGGGRGESERERERERETERERGLPGLNGALSGPAR